MDPAIDQKYLRLPPMLIQPYVENAIWHGLMQKKGGGSVTINFRQMTEQLLQVEVIDNGIGRVAAMALKSKSAITRKSYGMDLTARRLALLDNPENPSVFINVEDLLNENGEVAGTKVVLRIPV
jgi:LytS/YehU family sensor histidine kinase